MNTLYTARATIDGGRDGSAHTEDGAFQGRLAFPKALGGNGEGTNPEQLFAVGYGACFAATVQTLAKSEGKVLRNVHVDSEVDINLDNDEYDLAVRLWVRADGVEPADLEALIEKAKRACPYSRATRNNVATTVTAV